MSISQDRNNNFNIMRFVAALMVILGHMGHLLGAEVPEFMGQSVSTIGVKVFFLISGYLITNSYLHDSNGFRYTIRRFFRIIPGLAGVVIFTILIVGPIFTTLGLKDYFLHGMTRGYLRNIALYIQYSLPGVFADNIYPNAVNGSFWTLPIEVAMYIAVPIILLVFRRKHRLVPIVILAVIAEALNLIHGLVYPNYHLIIYGTDWTQAADIVPYFFVGMAFAGDRLKKYLNLQLAAALLLVGMMLNLSYYPKEIVAFLTLPYFVFSFALSPEARFSKCFARNDFSYGMYLYGFVVQQSVAALWGDREYPFYVYFIICSLITIALAALSWFVIEKPCQNLGKHILHSEKISLLPGKQTL